MYESLQTEEYKEIAVSAIHRTPDETGRGDPQKDPEIENLARNIKNQGLSQPITVVERALESGQYDVVIGNRRFEAWKMALPDKETIKCLVLPKDTSTTRKDMLTISENILRLNYTAHDRAKVIQRMIENWGGDKTSLAKALGYSSAKVINDWLAPLGLDPEVMQMLKGPASLTAKRATLIAKLPRPAQKQAAEIINEKATSEYEARKIINAIKHSPTEDPKTVVERLQSMPRTTSMMVSLSEPVNVALEKASADARLIKAKLAEKAIEEYLTRKGYLAGPAPAPAAGGDSK
jgi:ParB/RepB/Spo0J family partition protein